MKRIYKPVKEELYDKDGLRKTNYSKSTIKEMFYKDS